MLKEEMIVIKIEPKFKESLEKEAKEKGLNLSSYVRMILTERNK